MYEFCRNMANNPEKTKTKKFSRLQKKPLESLLGGQKLNHLTWWNEIPYEQGGFQNKMW